MSTVSTQELIPDTKKGPPILKAKADAILAEGKIVHFNGHANGEVGQVAAATNATWAGSFGPLFILKKGSSAASGDGAWVFLLQHCLMKGLDTSSASVGDPVFLSTAGGVTLTKPTTGERRVVGQVIRASSDTTLHTWLFNGCLYEDAVGKWHTLYESTAASAAVTNTITETAFDKSYTVLLNSLRAGSKLRIKFQGIATSTNGTDTLTIKVKIGSTVWYTSAAVDVANNDIFSGELEVVVRTAGGSGTAVMMGWATDPGAAGTVTAKGVFKASTTLDTTADQAITVTATWSVASASNSCRLDVLSIERCR